MTWIEIAMSTGGWIVVLGIVKYMVSSKVNKTECTLMHTMLQDDITEIKTDVKGISRCINDINIKLATMKGAASKSGLIIDQ